jgi:hypothetical protein
MDGHSDSDIIRLLGGTPQYYMNKVKKVFNCVIQYCALKAYGRVEV